MPRDYGRREGESIRLSLNINPEAYEILERLAKQRGTTVTDVLHKAIGLESSFQKIVDDGGQLVVEEKDGTLRRLIVRM